MLVNVSKCSGREFMRNNVIQSFLYKQHFHKQTRLKLAKNQAKAKPHREAELLLFENVCSLHSSYHPKVIGHTLKNV